VMKWMKHWAQVSSQIHRPDGQPNVFLFSTPRSGSTWLMELIWTQPGFRFCDEPLNIRNRIVARDLGIDNWPDLFSPDAAPKVERYFRRLSDGSLRSNGPGPWRQPYRPLTSRVVFKVIHAGHDRINWFRDRFNGRVVYLLRHPIAVSLSREDYPTMPYMLSGGYGEHLTSRQREFGREIAEKGNELERGVLAWCLQNMIPLRDATVDWAMISYEELVLNPEPVIRVLTEKLGLPQPARLMEQLLIPSASTRKSDAETRGLLDQREEQRNELVAKWRRHISEQEERSAMEILERFEIDAYRFGCTLPCDRFLAEASSPSVMGLERVPTSAS
jgi:hypothetical protein